MRNFGRWLLPLAVMGCTVPSSTNDEAMQPGLTVEQRHALGVLTSKTGVAWTVEQSKRFATPTFLAPLRRQGPRLLAGIVVTRGPARELAGVEVDSLTKATLDFLGEHRDLLRMRAPTEELVRMHASRDELSMTHLRLSQMERGIPVVGGELYAHYDEEGRLTLVQGSYVPALSRLSVDPSITSELARSAAIARISRDDLESETPRLVVNAMNGPPALAWEVRVRLKAGLGQWLVTVDAHTGSVLGEMNEIESVKGSGLGVGGDRKAIECVPSQQPGSFELVDATRSAQILTFNAGNGTDYAKTFIYQSSSTTAWDTVGTAAGAAVDAHVHAGVVYDFYKATLGRKGIDDKDSRIQNVVHWDVALDNAFYSFENGILHYGDGATVLFPLSKALDIVAHEYTHGVTFFTSNLRYENQAGALNESISDIFGVIVKHAHRPDPATDWLVGDAVVRGGGAIRDMANPRVGKLGSQPSHMKEFVNTQQDNGGVHMNSGIPNKAAHLMTVGGIHPVSRIKVENPLGFEKVAKVWYRANQRYLVASSDFALAAKATMEAATDLRFSQTDLDTIDCAWKAVGVVQGACAVATKSEPPPTMPESSDTSASPDSTDPSTNGDPTADTTEVTRSRKAPHGASVQTVTESGCTASPYSAGALDLVLVGVCAALMVLRRRLFDERSE
jgi:thermolysin